MRKLLVTATVAGLGLFGCQKSEREEVRQERQEVTEARSAYQEDAAKAQADLEREKANLEQDTNQELAEKREDVQQEEKELAQTEREAMNEGTGGSGTAEKSMTVTGAMKSSLGGGLTLTDAKGAELKLETDDQTVVMHEGKKVKLDDFEEGTQVRASYVTKDNDKLAREVTVLKAAPKK